MAPMGKWNISAPFSPCSELDSANTAVFAKHSQQRARECVASFAAPPSSGHPWHSSQKSRASLVAQWLRIRLPMQGTRVRALVREDPTCRGETKPVCHNYWACALEPASHNYWSPRATTTEARVPQLLKSACLEPVLCNKRSHRNEKPMHRNGE